MEPAKASRPAGMMLAREGRGHHCTDFGSPSLSPAVCTDGVCGHSSSSAEFFLEGNGGPHEAGAEVQLCTGMW